MGEVTAGYSYGGDRVVLYVRNDWADLHRTHLETAILAIEETLGDARDRYIEKEFAGGRIEKFSNDSFKFHTNDFGQHHWLSVTRDELFQLRRKLDEARKVVSR